MITNYDLTNVLNLFTYDIPIRVWAYSMSDSRIERYVEGNNSTIIFDKLDSLPDGQENYNYVIKIGMGN